MWDTGGQERFHALGPIYYRDADAAVLVYDITDADSFARVKTWVKELRQIAGWEILAHVRARTFLSERSSSVSTSDGEGVREEYRCVFFQRERQGGERSGTGVRERGYKALDAKRGASTKAAKAKVESVVENRA